MSLNITFFFISFLSLCSINNAFNYLDQITNFVKCPYGECCKSTHIIANFTKLEEDIKTKVYGQDLVDVVIYALKAHWNLKVKSKKALTISFHGWPGGGKNYVTKFIAESLYKEGTKSRFVHSFVGRIHFPREDLIEDYQKNLYDWVKGNVSECGQQLFIFDEVDKMPPRVLDAIKPIIDYKDIVDGVDYTRAIFMFLSNTGQNVINENYLGLWKKGKARQEMELGDFEDLISKGAFNEKGGFQYSDTIKSNLIDHYIPFLPMEKEHVIKCVLDDFRARGINQPKKEHIEMVMATIEWGPSVEKLFSKTGCKRISQKVGVVASKHYPVHDEL